MVGPPGRRGEEAERKGRQDGERAIEERCRHGLRVGSPERDERSGEAYLHDPDTGRRERDRSQDPDERPGSERLDARYLRLSHADDAEADDEEYEDGQMPGE